uniref:Putative rRNA methyltransferase n=1 Tax=Theileria annulata TaxID=5874 RepID=A0A3B0NAU7_THEAN
MKTKSKTGKNRLDKYYHLAKEHGYRSRSAFKIIQLSKKFNIFQNCNVLVDLCAAPGGWLQVASNQLPVSSTIIGVDLVPIKPIKGVTTFQADIRTPKCLSLITNHLNGMNVDVVLHDGSPNMGCNWNLDAFNQNVLVLTACKMACSLLRKGGIFVTKVFRSSDYNSLVWMLSNCFDKVKVTKPQSSRNVSAEIFAVCIGFKTLKLIDQRLFNPDYVFQNSELPIEQNELSQSNKLLTNTPKSPNHTSKTPNHVSKTLNQLLKEQKKINREGYEGPIYSEISVIDFLKSKEPAVILVTYNKLLFTTTNRNTIGTKSTDEELLEMVKENPLTTEEIKLLCSDLKVAGKSDLQSLLKWRFKLINTIPNLKITKSNPSDSTKSGKEVCTSSEATISDTTVPMDATDSTTIDTMDSSTIDTTVIEMDKKIKNKIESEKRRLERKQRKMLKKLKVGKNSNSSLITPDPDLFSLNSSNLQSYTEVLPDGSESEETDPESEESDVESQLPDDSESEETVVESKSDSESQLTDVESEETDIESEESEESDVESDELEDYEMKRLMNMEIDLEVRHSIDKINEQNTKHVKLSRKQKAKLEQSNELKNFINKLQYEAQIHHMNQSDHSDTEPDANYEPDDDNSEQGDSDIEPPHRDIEQDDLDGDLARNLDEDLISKRWFDNDIFKLNLHTNHSTKLNNSTKLDQHEQPKQPEQSEGDEIPNKSKENMDIKIVPAISNSEKEEIMGDVNKLAEIQALGSLMINKKTRMALIDGAYNKRTFTDEDLPSWFVEDENKHNKPQYPVTKELMKKYKAKLLELKNRPIKKVLEAKHRKALRAKKKLKSILPKIEAISNDREGTENPNKLLRGLKKIQSTKRQKVYVISRRSNFNKLTKGGKQKSNKGKGSRKVLKHVDRRMKQDNRRSKIKPKRKSRKIRPH